MNSDRARCERGREVPATVGGESNVRAPNRGVRRAGDPLRVPRAPDEASETRSFRLSRFGATEAERSMTSIVAIEELGRRIRKLRAERRMTLKQVEHVSGLSATHLSEIERGRTSPTIGALTRIARALEKDVAYFVEQDERPEVAHHLREQLAGFTAVPGVSVEALTPGIPGSGLFAYRVRLDLAPGAELRLAPQELPADTIVHVSAGAVSARAGGTEHDLRAGDTLQASLGAEQALRAAGAGGAECYVLSTLALEEIR